MNSRVRVAVLISGTGSNMAALIDAARDPACPFQVGLVLSNNPDAAGVMLAESAGVQTATVDHRPYGRDREAHERAVDAALARHEIELVALAGYMRVLTPWLVGRWAGRMLNIHPSLLPRYPGLNTHRRAIEAGDAEAGCTIHLVTEGVDEGPILAQSRVPILAHDTPDSLAERVKASEHRLYPAAVAEFAARLRSATA